MEYQTLHAEQAFLGKPEYFFEATRVISERFGYSDRASKTNPNPKVKTITEGDARKIFNELGISEGEITSLSDICAYINYRAEVLNTVVEPVLMDRAQAKQLFDQETQLKSPRTPSIMNKQKGDKKHESYLACLVQIQAEHVLGYGNFNNDPQRLAFLTNANGELNKCFARRFDGAVPSTVNPNVVWEIKEYYGTTTFGSRVSGGVYETLLDGFEIKQARQQGHSVSHYLFVDDRFTWWGKGKSYLCRIIDMLHTGHVDHVFFGSQVVSQFPSVLRSEI